MNSANWDASAKDISGVHVGYEDRSHRWGRATRTSSAMHPACTSSPARIYRWERAGEAKPARKLHNREGRGRRLLAGDTHRVITSFQLKNDCSPASGAPQAAVKFQW